MRRRSAALVKLGILLSWNGILVHQAYIALNPVTNVIQMLALLLNGEALL